MLEIASENTAENDVTVKRDDYAAFGIPEYWRFDPSGGEYYPAGLAGNRLVDGAYRPIGIVGTDDRHFWGRSEVLGLNLCWEDGQLRWYDPAAGCYLRTFDEEAEAHIAAQDERDVERRARLAAEERVRQLEAEIRRLRG